MFEPNRRSESNYEKDLTCISLEINSALSKNFYDFSHSPSFILHSTGIMKKIHIKSQSMAFIQISNFSTKKKFKKHFKKVSKEFFNDFCQLYCEFIKLQIVEGLEPISTVFYKVLSERLKLI